MSELFVNNKLEYDEEKMFTRLAAQFEAYRMEQSLKALYFARKQHDGAIRKASGQPYIVHPLLMSSIAMAMGLCGNDWDDLNAVILLHDIIEDTELEFEDLPVNETVRNGVQYMTFYQYPGEDKNAAKARYFRELIKSKEAVFCKGLDRYVNLSTMAGEFPQEKIRKNVVETDQLLMPILKEAKELWPEYQSKIWLIRVMIRSVNETLAGAYDVKLSGERLYGGAEKYDNIVTDTMTDS